MLHQIDFYKIIDYGKFDKQFNSDSEAIVEMYWHQLFLTKVRIGKIKKINIYIVTDEKYKSEDFTNDVKTLYTTFDFGEFQTLTPYNKKKLILDTVHNCLLSIANEQQIDVQKLQQAYNYCIENNLQNKWLLGGKQIKSPSKNYYGAIECHWEIDFFQITSIIYDNKKNELFRKELCKITFERSTGYLGYIYQYKPAWKVDTESNECLVFDIGNVFLKNQTSIKKWIINPISKHIKTENKIALEL